MTRKPFSLAFSDYANSNPQLLSSTYSFRIFATLEKAKKPFRLSYLLNLNFAEDAEKIYFHLENFYARNYIARDDGDKFWLTKGCDGEITNSDGNIYITDEGQEYFSRLLEEKISQRDKEDLEEEIEDLKTANNSFINCAQNSFRSELQNYLDILETSPFIQREIRKIVINSDLDFKDTLSLAWQNSHLPTTTRKKDKLFLAYRMISYVLDGRRELNDAMRLLHVTMNFKGVNHEYHRNHEKLTRDFKFFYVHLLTQHLVEQLNKLIHEYERVAVNSTNPEVTSFKESFVSTDLLNFDDLIGQILDEVEEIDSVVKTYFKESIDALNAGLLLSSAFTLGGASESLLYILGKSIHDYASDKPALSNLVSINSDKSRGNKLSKYIENGLKPSIKELHKQFKDTEYEDFFRELVTYINTLSTYYRQNRNEVGHPQNISTSFDKSEQLSHLYNFKKYVINIYKIINLIQN